MWWALTGGKGHERVGLGADSLGESGNKHDHRDRVQMGATMHRTTAKQTRVLGTNGWPSGAGENERGQERAPTLRGRMRQPTGHTRVRAQGYK
jgi:hypothetical protein